MPISQLFANPFSDPYLAAFLTVGGGLLGSGLGALLVLVRGNLLRLRASVLFARWRVWAVIGIVFGLAVAGGPALLATLLVGIALGGGWEYARLVGLPPLYRRALLIAGGLAAPVALLAPATFVVLPGMLLLAATLLPLLDRAPGPQMRHLAFLALGWGYVAWFPAHLVPLTGVAAGGPALVLALAIGTALSDIGAFVVGSRLGRHPLAPTISPHKTWEGVLGNVLGAYLGVGLLAVALPGALGGRRLLVLPLIIAGGALWGDLLESRLKRECGVKDAGGWLPGFGGLLDRIDSLLIVIPLVFYGVQSGVL